LFTKHEDYRTGGHRDKKVSRKRPSRLIQRWLNKRAMLGGALLLNILIMMTTNLALNRE
jgi:hypothetical protein